MPSQPNQAYDKPLSFLETIGMVLAILAGLVAAAFVMACLLAGAYVGWHVWGPWLAR